VEPDQRLQLPPPEAGATPRREVAYALAAAVAVLDAVVASGEIPAAEFGKASVESAS